MFPKISIDPNGQHHHLQSNRLPASDMFLGPIFIYWRTEMISCSISSWVKGHWLAGGTDVFSPKRLSFPASLAAGFPVTTFQPMICIEKTVCVVSEQSPYQGECSPFSNSFSVLPRSPMWWLELQQQFWAILLSEFRELWACIPAG